MYTVYVLLSLKDGNHYTGYTTDLERRLREHHSGKAASTKRRRPFVVIYKETCAAREEAEEREKYFKSGKGREELKQRLTDPISHRGAAESVQES